MDSYHRKLAAEELHLLILKLLEGGPCSQTLQVFKTELCQKKLIPKRLDWEGQYHEQTVESWLQQNKHIPNEYLLDLTLRLGPLVDKEFPSTTRGICSLLASGSHSLLRTKQGKERNFWRLSDYSVRHNLSPLFSSNKVFSYNQVSLLHGREVSGPVRKTQILNVNIFSRVKLINRTLGHLSAVYCVLFDRTGKYIITGADDFLVKVWSAIDGRLLCSLRGSSSEISDIAINVKNTLIAAGCLDKQIRVWCMQSSYPVATLAAHSGMITGVFFCPLRFEDSYYLLSTSSDGSIAFWKYSEEDLGGYDFPVRPVMYNEKIRPGQAQIICGSFSAGGMFFATGSADHHIRVYSMEGHPPSRIMEMEKHSERVDSIQWAHQSLRFVSGSRDGTAIVWQYRAQEWQTTLLLMNTKLDSEKVPESTAKLKTTMVCWSSDDSHIVTAVSDHSLKVWDSLTGKLLHKLTSHQDECYVVENHPFNPAVMFTAGHDGFVFIWDIISGKQLLKFENHIEGQGNGAVFDARWSPDGTMVAATDSHGHLIIYGLACYRDRIKDLPKEMFFHTDYRPLTRSADGHILDSQTMIPPHLMPPPFLVDIDGNPYPPTFQRLVPGRELCSMEQLIPNVVFNDSGAQEIIEGVPEENRRTVPRINGVLYESLDFSSRSRMRNPGNIEGIRNSSGNWQRDGFLWSTSVIVPPLSRSAARCAEKSVENMSSVELQEYKREVARPPEIVPSKVQQPQAKKKRIHNYRTRATWDHQRLQDSSSASEQSDDTATSDVTAITDELSGGSSSSDSESTVYSDWVADQGGVNLEPPQRSRRRRKRIPPAPAAPARKHRTPAPNVTVVQSPQPMTSEQSNLHVLPSTSAPSTSKAAQGKELSEAFIPSEWLSEVIPKKFPYYPQMGDEVAFFKRGYQLYVNAVQDKNVYIMSKTQLCPWGKIVLKEPEFVKIIGIKYEIRPPRLCCLRLALMQSNGNLTGERFTIKYHDVPDVLDFLVLKYTYDVAIERDWKIDDRFRSMIDDRWWWGVIINTYRRGPTDSHFLCHRIKWDNGEEEDMSPWDMEPPDSEREPDDDNGVLVLSEEIQATLYQPREDDWPCGGREAACARILHGLHQIMNLSAAEPFNAPVDINTYPTYATIVEYPVDLSLIKARFENRFYRRLTAAQFDVRYLATNAEKFNEPHSSIVKQARIVTDLCLQLMKGQCLIDVSVEYRQLADTYQSSPSDSDDADHSEAKSITNRHLRALRRAGSGDQEPDWRKDCLQTLDILFSSGDSEPFREPVDTLKYPDYIKVVSTPLDLRTIREELLGGNYEDPQQFGRDIRTMINNSKLFNTNKRSKVYLMTVRLSAMAEDCLKKVIKNWKFSSRKWKRKPNEDLGRGMQRKRRARFTVDYSPPDYDTDDDYTVSGTKSKGRKVLKSRHNFLSKRKEVQSQLAVISDKDDESPSENGDVAVLENGKDSSSSDEESQSDEDSSRLAIDEINSGASCSSTNPLCTVAGPSKHWAVNKNGVRILPPVRKEESCLEVLEVGQEVILSSHNNNNNNNAENSKETLNKDPNEDGVLNSEENESNQSMDDPADDEEGEEEDDDFVVVENCASSKEDGAATDSDSAEKLPSNRQAQSSRSLTTSEDSASGLILSRPRRTIRKKYFDESDDQGDYVRTHSRRSQRQITKRKRYKESSESEQEPEVSVSIHGRIRKLRPHARGFFRDS